jgi:ankyrin repeat protein
MHDTMTMETIPPRANELPKEETAEASSKPTDEQQVEDNKPPVDPPLAVDAEVSSKPTDTEQVESNEPPADPPLAVVTDASQDAPASTLLKDTNHLADNDSVTEDGDFHLDRAADLTNDLEALDDPPAKSLLHAADEVKKRLEEMDPCEKLRALCKKGEVEELEAFLQQKHEPELDIDYVSSDGWTCLHEIITHGCQFTDIARVLLQHGAK